MIQLLRDTENTGYVHLNKILPNAEGKPTPVVFMHLYSMARTGYHLVDDVAITEQDERYSKFVIPPGKLGLDSGTYLYKMWPVGVTPTDATVIKYGIAYVADTDKGAVDTLQTTQYTVYEG